MTTYFTITSYEVSSDLTSVSISFLGSDQDALHSKLSTVLIRKTLRRCTLYNRAIFWIIELHDGRIFCANNPSCRNLVPLKHGSHKPSCCALAMYKFLNYFAAIGYQCLCNHLFHMFPNLLDRTQRLKFCF